VLLEEWERVRIRTKNSWSVFQGQVDESGLKRNCGGGELRGENKEENKGEVEEEKQESTKVVCRGEGCEGRGEFIKVGKKGQYGCLGEKGKSGGVLGKHVERKRRVIN